MRSAQSIKRELFLGIAVSAFVFMCALAWGKPFVSTGSFEAPMQAQQSQAQNRAPHAIFTGTIVRNGEQFVLHDSSGQYYRLDDPQHAQPFEGKAVKITGTLDREARLIHIERIESAMA